MNGKRLMTLAAAALIASAPGVAAAATKVVVWHSYRGKERSALEQVAETFNKREKDVQIELLPIPFDAFPDKVNAAIPRGKGPDLFIFAQDRLGAWAASGLVESVDFWVDDALRAKYLPQTIDALTYNGTLYALPIAFKSVALFYNKKLVPQPPKTTDELLAVAKKVTDAKSGRFGLAYENANFYYQAAWMQGWGGRVFDKKRNPSLATQEVIDSMQFAQDLAHSGVMPQEISSTLVTTLFNKGKVGMVINGPWFIAELEPGVDYGVSVMPVISKTGKPAMPFLGSEGVIMSAKTTDKKAAFKVMEHLTSTESGLVMAKVGRQTPARKEVYDDPAVAKDPILSVFRAQLANTVPMPNSPAMQVVWSPATTAMNKIINGKAAPAEAMKQAQAEVEQLVKGARR